MGNLILQQIHFLKKKPFDGKSPLVRICGKIIFPINSYFWIDCIVSLHRMYFILAYFCLYIKGKSGFSKSLPDSFRLKWTYWDLDGLKIFLFYFLLFMVYFVFLFCISSRKVWDWFVEFFLLFFLDIISSGLVR